MKPYLVFIFILISLNIKAFGQIVEDYTYPKQTRVQCQYHCSVGIVKWWQLPDNCITTNSGYEPWEKVVNGSTYLYLKWKNIEASAQRSQLDLHWYDNGDPDHVYYTYTSVGPFQLSFPAPTFAGGSTKNIPCYSTDPVTISLNPYKNTGTASEDIDENLTITSHFKWTLPYGWETTDGKTGTFEIQSSSITVIPTASSSSCDIQVLPFADGGYESNQYGTNAATLHITRNLEDFAITGQPDVVVHETYHYEVPSHPGVSYSWQLPADWQGSSTTNSIDVTIGCDAGNIIATMTGCNNQSKSAQLSVTKNLLHPGTGISGPSVVCSSGTSYRVVDLPPGATITWDCSNYISRTSVQGANPCIFAATGQYESWIEATIHTSCGDVTLPRKTVWAGLPMLVGLFGYTTIPSWLCSETPYIFIPDLSIGSTVTSITGLSGGVEIPLTEISSGYYDVPGDVWRITLTLENSCGSETIRKFIRKANCLSLSISPNPSTGETTLTIESDTQESESMLVIDDWDLEVYDQSQQLKAKKSKLKGKEYKLNTSGWKEGVYIVRVIYKDEVLTGKLVVKRL